MIKHKINKNIRAKYVRLVEENGKNDVYSIEKALSKAEESNLDLVEVGPTAKPPVCKIMDYKKFLFEKKKNNKKPVSKPMKEIRFTPTTDDHDINFKLRHAQNFLKKGHKVKLMVFFKGREISYSDQGKILLLEFIQSLEGLCRVEQLPKLEGKRMFAVVAPSN